MTEQSSTVIRKSKEQSSREEKESEEQAVAPVIPVIAVGGQYNHLIMRMLTELGAKSKLVPASTTLEQLNEMGIGGLAMGGGPQRVHEAVQKGEFETLSRVLNSVDVPVLGICVTHQLMAVAYGGEAGPAIKPEYGPTLVVVDQEDSILRGMGSSFTAWSSHNDEVSRLPPHFQSIAHSEYCKVEAMKHESKPIFGVQFHPEVVHTQNGSQIFKNLLELCTA